MNKRIKFNILDFCIILFAILLIFASLFWKDIRGKFILNEKNAEYSFVVKGLTEETVKSVSIGDNFYFSEDGTYAGKIDSVEYEREIHYVSLIDGSNVEYESDLYTLSGKVKITGKEKENGFYIGEKYFTVPGKKFYLETDSVELIIEITRIDY